MFLVLHPCHKLRYFKDANWTPEWIDAAHSIEVRDEYKRKYAALDEVEVVSDSVRQLQLTIYITNYTL